MTFMHMWPTWVVIPLALILAAVCVLGWRGSRDTATWTRRGLMVLCLLAIGLTPATTLVAEDRVSNAEYYFVVDLTGSMAADDYDGTRERLEGVRADMADIIEQNPGGRYSVIAFSSTATEQLPLTTDSRAVLAWLETARRESSNRSYGSSINRPRAELESALDRAAENNPQNVRIVLFFTDGENTDTRHSDSSENVDYESLGDRVDDGYVFGYGTAEGGRMLRSDWGESRDGEYIVDPATGQPAVSKIDEDNLRDLADQLDISYMHAESPGRAGELVRSIPVDSIAGDGRDERGTNNPLLWPLGLALIGLVGWELWHITPKIAALRRIE